VTFIGYFAVLTLVGLLFYLMDFRKKAHLTQDDLAKRTGTKKSYISRLENGKIDIQISTLFKIFEEGLGKKLGLTIQ